MEKNQTNLLANPIAYSLLGESDTIGKIAMSVKLQIRINTTKERDKLP